MQVERNAAGCSRRYRTDEWHHTEEDDRVSALRRLRRRVRALLRRWWGDSAQRLREVTGRDDPT
jgi:hypothetical protein